MMVVSAWNYFKTVWAEAWRETKAQAVGTTWGIIAAVIGVYALAYLEVNPDKQTPARIVGALPGPLIVAWIFLAYRLIRAPWKLHQQALLAREQALEQQAASSTAALKEAERASGELSAQIEKLTLEIAETEKRRGQPQIVLNYRLEAQRSQFQLTNTGLSDATSVIMGPIGYNDKRLVWKMVGRVSRGETVPVADPTRTRISEPDVVENNPLAPDGGRHMRAIQWLIERDNTFDRAAQLMGTKANTFVYEFDCPLAYDGDEGRSHYSANYKITFDLVTKDLVVTPAQR